MGVAMGSSLALDLASRDVGTYLRADFLSLPPGSSPQRKQRVRTVLARGAGVKIEYQVASST